MYIYDKLENDAFNSDGIVSLNIRADFTKDLELLKKDAWIKTSLTIPVLSYLNRIPDYYISGMKHIWTGPENFRRVVLRAELIKILKYSEENRISISYEWDLWYIDEPDIHKQVRVANHRLKLGFWLKKM